MNSLPAIFFTSFLIGLSGALMPGPLLTVTIGESSRAGARVGPLIILGHAVLEIALVILLFCGIAPLFTNNIVIAAISLAGSGILIWMAAGMFRKLPTLALATVPGPGAGSHGRLVSSGILISLSNPAWSVWWATVGLAYVLQARIFGITGVIVFFCGHILADLVWYSGVSFAIAKGRRFFSDVFYRMIVGGCAVFLVIFSGYFFVGGLQRLVRHF